MLCYPVLSWPCIFLPSRFISISRRYTFFDLIRSACFSTVSFSIKTKSCDKRLSKYDLSSTSSAVHAVPSVLFSSLMFSSLVLFSLIIPLRLCTFPQTDSSARTVRAIEALLVEMAEISDNLAVLRGMPMAAL